MEVNDLDAEGNTFLNYAHFLTIQQQIYEAYKVFWSDGHHKVWTQGVILFLYFV